ncbi:MAG: mycothiol synthase [Frankiaceae bacterium]|jgi:mycothiol synthase|nr:mycothiol synthase [Frankiaceae bacterium]
MTDEDERIECASALSGDLSSRIVALAQAAARADGVPPLSDHALVHVRNGGAGVLHFLLWVGGDLAAYAHLDASDVISGAQAELAVDPGHRAAGHARTLVRALIDASPDGRLQLWAHGERPEARRLAEGMGFTRTRVLAQMGRPLDASLQPPDLPAHTSLRSFVPGDDEVALLAVNNAAFVDHPDQGKWQLADLLGREREPWFDPAGLLLLELDGRLAGFVWTKVHGTGASGHTHDPVGEIYVLGVAPWAHRRGLGRTLAAAGLAHLAALGLPEAMLYVDEANSAAVGLYEGLGFTRRGVDALFALRPR